MKTDILSLCWSDEDTLIVGDLHGKQLVKYTTNITEKYCEGVVMDTGYTMNGVSCTQDGKVYVTEYKPGNVTVRIYDVKSGYKEVWNTSINSKSGGVHIAVSDRFIVLSSDRDSHVFNINQTFQYKITHRLVSNYLIQTYISDDSFLWGIAFSGYKLLVLNLLTNNTRTSSVGIVEGDSISGARNGYVYVIDRKSADIGIYSQDGTFLHYLRIVLPDWARGFFYCAAFRSSEQEAHVAFTTQNNTLPIAIFKLHQ